MRKNRKKKKKKLYWRGCCLGMGNESSVSVGDKLADALSLKFSSGSEKVLIFFFSSFLLLLICSHSDERA